MWNIAASSKILQDWSHDKHYHQHKQRIAKMRSVIKLKHPDQPEFIYAKPKLEMARRDRLFQIARQNDILVRKMNFIYDSKHEEDKLKPESQRLKTLNQHTNNQVQVKIDDQNKKLCTRIMQAHTHYPTYKIVNDSARLQKTSLNISANARRFRSFSKQALGRPQSATFLNGSRFVRSGGQKQNRYQEQFIKQKTKVSMRPMSAPSKKAQHVRANSRLEMV